MSKQILIIAGPNGAGKTTFARSFLPHEACCLRFINADLIAAGLAPFAPETAALKAGRLMLSEVADCIRLGVSFALETTLSGTGDQRKVREWRSLGYSVSLYFLSLPNPDMAISRVKERVRQGGHAIPEEVIRRRFTAGLRNFKTIYKQEVDAWIKFNNMGDQPILSEWNEKGRPCKDIREASDPVLWGSLAALRRAADHARLIALQTGTDLIVFRNGEVTRISARELAEQTITPLWPPRDRYSKGCLR
jgi:predicted ABC-type ATPase